MMSPRLSVELELVPPISFSVGDCGFTGQETCNPGMTQEGVSTGPVQERLLKKGGELRAAYH